MKLLTQAGGDLLARHRLFLSCPRLWLQWPFLPVVRRQGGSEELGVLFDAMGVCGLPGHSATVFRCNYFELPDTVAGLLALPREVCDSPEELAAKGWRVDVRSVG